jgi:hypothetical protein
LEAARIRDALNLTVNGQQRQEEVVCFLGEPVAVLLTVGRILATAVDRLPRPLLLHCHFQGLPDVALIRDAQAPCGVANRIQELFGDTQIHRLLLRPVLKRKRG